jgi:sugar phosphate isomerase/epimerase
MGLFTRRSGLGKRLDGDRRQLGVLASQFASDAEHGEFDLFQFTVRAFELAPTKDIAWLAEHGIDGREFWGRELKPCWEGLTREQRAGKIASFVRFANLLDRSEPEAGSSVTERLWELRSSVRTKIVLLGSAYDCQYGDTYCRRIAKNPQQFGDYELSRA